MRDKIKDMLRLFFRADRWIVAIMSVVIPVLIRDSLGYLGIDVELIVIDLVLIGLLTIFFLMNMFRDWIETKKIQKLHIEFLEDSLKDDREYTHTVIARQNRTIQMLEEEIENLRKLMRNG